MRESGSCCGGSRERSSLCSSLPRADLPTPKSTDGVVHVQVTGPAANALMASGATTIEDYGAFRIVAATVKQTPDAAFNGFSGGLRAGDLATWINANLAAVTAGTHSVPSTFPFAPGGDFLGAATPNNIDFWNAPGIATNAARFQFSLHTCDGCHGRETNTFFTMVNTAGFGAPATLAGFLTGITVTDPVDPMTTHTFNDLLERAGKLQSFADAFCGPFRFPPPFPLPVPPFPLPPIVHAPILMAH